MEESQDRQLCHVGKSAASIRNKESNEYESDATDRQ